MMNLLSLIVSATPASAQSIIDNGIPGCNFATGVLTAQCIPNFIAHVIQYIVGFLGAGFLIVIIWSGYEYALGSAIGSSDAGKQRLFTGIVGFLVSVLSFAIIDFIISTLS